MPLPKTVLLAAGDPGGANALRPVVQALAIRRTPIAVLNHGTLGRGWGSTISLVEPDHPFDLYCFGTSLTDRLPLTIARRARAEGKKIVCVLDNWVNYRARLCMDGLPPLIPDYYAVMDVKARDEALREGIPDTCLVVTGHPNLGSLSDAVQHINRDTIRRKLGLSDPGRQMVAFINEPVAQDQGSDASNPGWRGYTERDALAALAQELGSKPVDLAIIPHPRDDLNALKNLWDQVRGPCTGMIIEGLNGREVMVAADRVAGMTSILLYESWLLGKPTLSLQPGLVRDDLLSIAERPGIFLVRHAQESRDRIAQWLGAEPCSPQPDLALHTRAAETIADLLNTL